MGRGNPIPTAVRTAVDERDRRQCLRCGAASRALHHRQRRREGGHPLSSVISVCNSCHRYIHAHPTEARENGWIVSAYEGNPALVPLRHFTGQMILLSEDGSASYLAADGSA